MSGKRAKQKRSMRNPELKRAPSDPGLDKMTSALNRLLLEQWKKTVLEEMACRTAWSRRVLGRIG